jgi:hypothetical protein
MGADMAIQFMLLTLYLRYFANAVETFLRTQPDTCPGATAGRT